MKIFKKGHLSDHGIVEWLTDMRGHVFVPESGFAVTAVFRAQIGEADDYYFAGVNVENAEHRLSTHGEEGALAALVTGLGRRAEIIEGWVMGARQNTPASSDNLASCCGKCRQQIAGFARPEVKIHSVALNGKISTTTVGAFLPDVFSFRQFVSELNPAGGEDAPALSRENVQNRLIRQGNLPDNEIFSWLRNLEPVDYASRVPQSVVLQLDNGSFVAGVKVEEAAFNGMNAVQCALAIAVAEFGACRIQGVWVYTKGKGGAPGALSLSALQSLLRFAQGGETPIRFFADDGRVLRSALADEVSRGCA